MKRATRCLVVLLVLSLSACGEPDHRLDEYEFYSGPQFRLKLVRYYRNIPFHPLGTHGVVMCSSANTADFPADGQQDAGWRVLGPVAIQDEATAREAAAGVQDAYQVVDDRILIAKTTAFNISFDACGHFISWDPARLPASMLASPDSSGSCLPHGAPDCRGDFEGVRAPRYDRVSVAGSGQVGFTATSRAFRGVDSLRVHTRNLGAVWHVDSVGPAADGRQLTPDTLRSLSVASLEPGMPALRLVDWLESLLPPGSVVLWPDAPAPCRGRPGNGGETGPALCAEIRFSDAGGNGGVLRIALKAAPHNGPPEAAFIAGVYVAGGKEQPVGSLAGLREHLGTGQR